MIDPHLAALARLAVHGLRTRGRPRPARAAVPRARVAVERRGIRLDASRLARYLAATDGERIAAYRGDGALLPPTGAAVWETALALDLLVEADAPFPTRGVVHAGSELVQLRPLALADRFRCRLELDRWEPHPAGARVTALGRTWNARGQLCLETRTELLLRTGECAGREGGAGRWPERPESGPAAWREVARWSLAGGQGRRYARASGDYNPIHLWGWTARPFGFPHPVLHGFCTQALVANAVVEQLLGGDPATLRRLAIDFRTPLPLPSTVSLQVAGPDAADRHRFRVIGEEAARPFAEGEFVAG